MRIVPGWSLIAGSLLLQACAPSPPPRPAAPVTPAAPSVPQTSTVSTAQPAPAAPAAETPSGRPAQAPSSAVNRGGSSGQRSEGRSAPPAPVSREKPAPSRAATPTPKPAPATARRPPSASAPAASAAPAAPAAKPATPSLDLAGLESRLRDTHALGIFTKLTLKNQVDDLLQRFGLYHSGQGDVKLAQLRQSYDMLLAKVVGLLQGKDPGLANAIASSREPLWRLLVDPVKFAAIRN